MISQPNTNTRIKEPRTGIKEIHCERSEAIPDIYTNQHLHHQTSHQQQWNSTLTLKDLINTMKKHTLTSKHLSLTFVEIPTDSEEINTDIKETQANIKEPGSYSKEFHNKTLCS